MKKLTKCLRKDCLRRDKCIAYFFLFIIKMSYYKKKKRSVIGKDI